MKNRNAQILKLHAKGLGPTAIACQLMTSYQMVVKVLSKEISVTPCDFKALKPKTTSKGIIPPPPPSETVSPPPPIPSAAQPPKPVTPAQPKSADDVAIAAFIASHGVKRLPAAYAYGSCRFHYDLSVLG